MDLSNMINGVKPEESIGGALPAGNYNVMIEKVEFKDTKSGGKAISLWLRVFGEKYANAVIFDSVNVAVPSSEQATQIGKSRIAKIAQIMGSPETNNWLNKAVTIYAKVKKQEGYEDKNEVSSYSAYDNAGQGTTPTANQSTNNAGPTTTASEIPW